MTVSTLDPQTALIVVDLQKGIVSLPTAHPVDGVITQACALADAHRHRKLPVVLVNVAGGAPGRTEHTHAVGTRPDGWSELIPEMNQQPHDHVVSKRTWGAFTGTGLAEHLKGLGVTQVVIAGVATSIGVESTARQAPEHGFHVTPATDAMTDLSSEAHDNSATRIFPRLGEIGTTAEIIAVLDKRAGQRTAGRS